VRNHPGYCDVIVDQDRLNAIVDSEDVSAELLEQLEGDEEVPRPDSEVFNDDLLLFQTLVPTKVRWKVFVENCLVVN
jgi:hypothetical protein